MVFERALRHKALEYNNGLLVNDEVYLLNGMDEWMLEREKMGGEEEGKDKDGEAGNSHNVMDASLCIKVQDP